jgi:nitrogen fixation protein FixH
MPAEPRRREPWPVILAALLVAMMGASIGFWRLATRHPDALVATGAREADHFVPEALRAARRADALGWAIDLAAEPRPGAAALRVALRDAHGAPLAAERVLVRRERPAEGGLDAEQPLARAGADWSGTIALPRAGRWLLVVRAERGEEAAERSFAFWAPAGAAGAP